MMGSDNACKICETGTLLPQVDVNTVTCNGQTKNIEMRFSVCAVCGSEQADAEQLRTNKHAMLALRDK